MSVNAHNRHINIRYHFVRKAVTSNQIEVLYCASKEQAAEILTKPLLQVLFEKMAASLGLVSAEGLNRA